MANYSKGKIAIPNLTGNIVINIQAVPSVIPVDNLIDTYGIANNTRVKLSTGENYELSGFCAVGANNEIGQFPISNGDTIRIKGADWSAQENVVIAWYSAAGVHTSNDGDYLFDGHTSSRISCSYDKTFVKIVSENMV